jgi:hypothetical protein
MLALIVDIAIGTSGHWTSMREAEGMVLLDEIEAHLHPEWRMMVVEGLRKAFPRLAFIATTHDPLCLKGLDAGEITVLQRDENGSVAAQTHMPSVYDLPADEILTSELFGLPSARNQSSPVDIARLSALLAQRQRTAAEESELKKLRDRIGGRLSAALTPMQREVEKMVTEALQTIRTRPLPEETVAEIRRQVQGLEGAGADAEIFTAMLGPETAQPEISREIPVLEIAAEAEPGSKVVKARAKSRKKVVAQRSAEAGAE